MKTRKYGRAHWNFICFRYMARIDQEKIHAIQTDAYHDYLRSRANGTSQDTPRKEMHVPREGDFTWVGGERVGSYVHGVEDGPWGEYYYELRYDPAPDVLEWMTEKDCNYLMRILREGRLRELEPDVWCLREMEHAQDQDIGAWWRGKLQQPNIKAILKRAKWDHRQWVAREESARTAREKQEREEREAQERAERESQARLAQLQKKLQPFLDLTKKLEPLIQAVTALQAKISGVRLDLSDLPFKFDEKCWRELAALFAAINNFTEINLSNTGLDQKTWEEILLPSLINNPNLTASPDTTLSIVSELNPCGFSYNASQLLEVIAARKLAILQAKYAATTSALRKLIKNPGLVDLDLSNQPLTPEHMELICQIVATCPNLRTLNLSHTNLSYDAARVLVVGLHQHHSLQSVTIEGCALPKSIVLQLQAQVRYAGAKIIGAAGAMRDILPPREEERRKILATVPAKFRCHITGKIMLDPVVAADGEIYEREAIEVWLETHDTAPKSQERFRHKELCPHKHRKQKITAFLEQYKALAGSDEIYLSQKLIERFLQIIKEKNSATFIEMLANEPRLLTCELDQQHTTLLTAVSRHGDIALLNGAIEQLGDLFWQAPEIVGDSGMQFFRDVALTLGIDGAGIIAAKFAWGREEFLLQLAYVDALPEERVEEGIKLADICFNLWLQYEKLPPTMLLHLLTQHLHNKKFCERFLQAMMNSRGREFVLATVNAKNARGQTAMVEIAQTQSDDFILSLWQFIDLAPADFYNLVAASNSDNFTVAHIVARDHHNQLMHYLLTHLLPQHSNQLLPLKTLSGENILELVAKKRSSKTLMELLGVVSPAAVRAALNNQLPSKELIDILQRRHTQAIIDLLRAKYMLIDNCRKLQQQVTTALQIFATGMFTTDWAKQFITLTATWQQLQPHFATVLSGEADDYQVVSELQRDWQRFAPIRKVLARIENQAQAQDQFAAISTEERQQLIDLFAQIFQQSPTFFWQWPSSPLVFEFMAAALVKIKDANKATQFTFEQAVIDPELWLEFTRAIASSAACVLNIALPRSLNAKLVLNHPALTALDVSDNPLGYAGTMLDNLVTQLTGHARLQILKLNNCDLGVINNSFLRLAALLPTLAELTHLELRGIDFTVGDHFAALLGYLQTNPKLTHLDLSACQITIEQTKQLGTVVLEHNLNLIECKIDKDTAASRDAQQLLVDALQRNRMKEELEIKYRNMCAMHDEFAKAAQEFTFGSKKREETVGFAMAMEKKYRDVYGRVSDFTLNNYPTPAAAQDLVERRRQNAILVIKLWEAIIFKESDGNALMDCYASGLGFFNEFIVNDAAVLASLQDIYVTKLLETRNLLYLRQAIVILSKIPVDKVTRFTAVALAANCKVLAKQYILGLLQSLRSSISLLSFWGLTRKDVELFIQKLGEVEDYGELVKITRVFIEPWRDRESKFTQLREMAEFTQAVTTYVVGYERLFGSVVSKMCAAAAASAGTSRSASLLAPSAPSIAKMADADEEASGSKTDRKSSRELAERDEGEQAKLPQSHSDSATSQPQLYPSLAATFTSVTAATSSDFFAGNGRDSSHSEATTSSSSGQQPSAPSIEHMTEQEPPSPISALLRQITSQTSLSDIPVKFKCPISLEIMTRPVVIETGAVFDRDKIVTWFSEHDTDPVTNRKVANKTILIPSIDRQGEIIEYLEEKLRQQRQQTAQAT